MGEWSKLHPGGSNGFQVWVVSLPVTVLNSPPVTELPVPNLGTPADIAGIIIWVVGWLLETQADVAKVLFLLLL
jgi:hypothetical protein